MKKTIYEDIEEVKANRAALLKELEDNLKAAEAEEAEKEKIAAGILETGTAEEYAAAKAEARTAADKMEFYTKRISDIKATSLFTEEEKERYKNELSAVMEKKKATRTAEAKAAIEKAYNAIIDYRATLFEFYKYCDIVDGANPKQPRLNNEVISVNGLSGELEAMLKNSELLKIN